MMREGFLALTTGWRADGFDALMTRIDLLGNWVAQNGGPDGLGADEGQTVVDMMACAIRHGFDGALPKRERAVQ
jgi:hypothetical protein